MTTTYMTTNAHSALASPSPNTRGSQSQVGAVLLPLNTRGSQSQVIAVALSLILVACGGGGGG
ncbi:MAG: hypothetical protein K8963_06325, partial [Proteobacteria bacterium]|nr:hypothetical protein [Pseudomonadota bacterium]